MFVLLDGILLAFVKSGYDHLKLLASRHQTSIIVEPSCFQEFADLVYLQCNSVSDYGIARMVPSISVIGISCWYCRPHAPVISSMSMDESIG